MLNGINQNGDITQAQAKLSVGVPVSTPWNGKDYANSVNMKARDRLAKYRKTTRIMDSLQAINRFKWSNLPQGLRSQIMERVYYFRGQGMWYWDKTLESYYYLPFAMTSENNQTIDFYGQYMMVKPMPFNGRSDVNKKCDGKLTREEVYLGTITRKPIYDMETLKATIAAKGKDWCKENCCIIGYDYTQQISQYVEPRSITQEVWIEAQAEIPLFFRTALLKALMPKLVRTSDQGTMDAVIAELQSVEDSILEGKTMIPVTAFQEMQEIDTATQVATLVETILKAYDSVDNIRKAHLGLAGNGAFQKQSGMMEGEQKDQSAVDLILSDALNNRQYFCDLVNELFDLKIYADESEGMDPEHEAKFEEEEAGEMAKMDAGEKGVLRNGDK